MVANVLFVETLRKRYHVKFNRMLSLWEIHDYCKRLFSGKAPQIITISGDRAIATYQGVL